MQKMFFLKKRQYNVTSKNLFVISSHHLLDASTTVDCTISSESKGQECLDNVCQRLSIQQPEFFGLRYVVKGKEDEMKWVDLERSLSRQLEKYAAGTKIFLRIRHYVTTGVRHLSDEVTRYYYFLQLKSDIYEGKIACDIRTAILLALYCRQAEYDSYQGDKQSKDYLKKSLVLPKNLQGLCNDENLLDSLILEVLQQNVGIQHLSQSQAEEMYIQCCQQLDGYGEERFNAKDTLGNDLLLGLAINGMVVNADNGRQYFPWKDFHTATMDKRTIKIEQNKPDGSIVGSFIFPEAETARYFWKLCINQHKFFKRYIDEDSPSLGDVDSHNGLSIAGGGGISLADTSTAGFAYDFNDSRENILLEQQQRAIYSSAMGAAAMGGPTGLLTANPEFISAQSLHQHQQQLPHGLMASNNSSSALMSSNVSLAASHQSGGGNGTSVGGLNNNIIGGGVLMHAHSGGALAPNWHNKDYVHDYASSQHLSHSMLDTRLQSSSCLDLSNNNLHNSSNILGHSNNNNHLITADAHERERLKAMLPTYRPAPDYETAVQLKYHSSTSNVPYSTAAPPDYAYAGSQPDVHNAAAIYGEGVLSSHLATHRYPDVTQPAMHAAHAGGIDLSQRLQIMRSKPPPPYPVNRLSSSSTPDLAKASHRHLLGYRACVSGSSPDLVSNRNFHNSYHPYGANSGINVSGAGVMGPTSSGATMIHQYPAYLHSQSYLPHGTFENLNMIEEQPSIMSQLRQSALSQAAAAQAAASANQSFEQNSPSSALSKSLYGAGSTNAVSTNAGPSALQRNAMNGSVEPIYENVPLPPFATPARNSELQSSNSSSHANERMFSATPSVAPIPAARHHKKQQQQQQKIAPIIVDEPDEISMNIKKFSNHTERAASTELQFMEPNPLHRVMRAASAAPAIGVASSTAATAPPRHSRTPNSNNTSSSAANLSKSTASSSLSTADLSHSSVFLKSSPSRLDESSLLHQPFSAMNLSSNSSASMYSSTLDTTGGTTSTSSSKEGKRKNRWKFLGRSKTPDKHKSATLGREKTNSSAAANKINKMKMAQDDLILPNRWSTGAPKLQPISGQLTKDKLCQILDAKLNDTQLFKEFEAIPKRRENAQYQCALMEENAMKNSDPNFLPYDDNRVRITPSRENRHGYVNASHISSTVGTKQRFYIVAQSPHDELTTHIFWQCVWEADVYLVVQLSDELNYIPPNPNQRLEFGQFLVYQEFSQTSDRCITSKLRLYHIQSRRCRSVWHLSYTDWAEQNCPRDVNHFLEFLEELNSVRLASIDEVPPGHNTNPPVLIHCLEGGGRSGVTLTADLLLYTLDHNEDLHIIKIIEQLRHQRDSIIPSLAQYKFIYSLLITYLKRTRLI